MSAFQENQIPGDYAQTSQPQLQPKLQPRPRAITVGLQKASAWGRVGLGGEARCNTHHVVKYEEGLPVSFLCFERRHLDFCAIGSSLLWLQLSKQIILSPLGTELDALWFSASLEPMDCNVHVLS